mmetsp:Transcript_129423/g.360495  ORF Transcript_129423/g.360495 Transcript_129423/m.360495 type:complete len:238 (-) Transcript_129423:331-1044(-)
MHLLWSDNASNSSTRDISSVFCLRMNTPLDGVRCSDSSVMILWNSIFRSISRARVRTTPLVPGFSLSFSSRGVTRRLISSSSLGTGLHPNGVTSPSESGSWHDNLTAQVALAPATPKWPARRRSMRHTAAPTVSQGKELLAWRYTALAATGQPASLLPGFSSSSTSASEATNGSTSKAGAASRSLRRRNLQGTPCGTGEDSSCSPRLIVRSQSTPLARAVAHQAAVAMGAGTCHPDL